MRRRLAPTEPSLANVARINRNLQFVRWPLTFALLPWIRFRATGLEHFPMKGPVLVVSNHVGFMDPVVIILSANRTISFMATPSLLDEGMLARVMRWFGVIPKKKFIADTSAIRRLKAWVKHGGAVGLFPEAVRCWDGQTAALMPGTERLVKMLGVPVVTVRIRNAYRQWPRWAERARRGKILVEFDPPRTFTKKTPDEEIMAYMTERLQVRHDEAPCFPVTGKGLARGISNVVWACPSCGAFGKMAEDDDHISCTACNTRWRVDPTTDLIAEGSSERLRIDEVIARITEGLRARDMVPDPERFAADGVLMESEPMQLIERTDDEPIAVAEGRLRLDRDTLCVIGDDGASRWSLALDELRVVTVDMRRRLQFRTHAHLYEAMIPTESVVVWELVAAHWAPRVK